MLLFKKSKVLLTFFSAALLFALPAQVFPQETGTTDNTDTIDMALSEDNRKEIDLYSLEELLNVKIEVASLFAEDELVAGSTVSSITPSMWKRLGAKRTTDALNNELNVFAYPYPTGAYAMSIRGFANNLTVNGVSFLLDGVPMNEITGNSTFTAIPNWELGTLNKIEMIKGPGSAIYGSDAFTGVISMKTFESDKDCLSVEGSIGFPVYGDASMNLSYGMLDNLIRIDAAAGLSHQSDLDMEYEYDDQGTTGTGKRKYQYDSETGVLKINITPADRLKIKAGGYIYSWDGRDFVGVTMAPGNLRQYDQSSYKIMVMMGNGSASYTAWNNISIELSGYYWQENVNPFTVNTNVGYMELKPKGYRSGASIIIKQPDNAINLQWLVAYSFSRMEIKNDKRTLFNVDGDFLMDMTDFGCGGFSRDINSGFTQLRWIAIKDTLHILAGGRIDNYSDFGNQITPRGGIIFLPAAKSSVKALYGRAFKAPNATEIIGTLPLTQGNEDLKPETIDTYELIYIYKEKDWKISLNTFYSAWNDEIIIQMAQAQGGLGKYMNKGDSRAYGGELSLFYSFSPFAVDLGFSYVKSTALNILLDETTGEKEDQDYLAFPEYSVICGLHYFLKPAEVNFFLNNRLYLNMSEYPKELSVTTGENSKKLPPYYRMDLNISKSISNKLDIYLDIRNILNAETHIPSLNGAHEGYEEPGISVLLRAGYKI